MDKEIGTRIRGLRRQHHMTQTQIYETCGISSGNLSSIENGKILPSAAALMALAKCLNCSTDYILFGIDSNEINAKLTQEGDMAEEIDLLSSYRQLTADDREEIRMLIDFKLRRISREHED